MQKEELIVLTENDGRRKTYAITAYVEQVLRQEYKRLKSLIVDGEILKEGDLYE